MQAPAPYGERPVGNAKIVGSIESFIDTKLPGQPGHELPGFARHVLEQQNMNVFAANGVYPAGDVARVIAVLDRLAQDDAFSGKPAGPDAGHEIRKAHAVIEDADIVLCEAEQGINSPGRLSQQEKHLWRRGHFRHCSQGSLLVEIIRGGVEHDPMTNGVKRGEEVAVSVKPLNRDVVLCPV
ncbi:MAG: hypothetical protein IPG20_01200 [Gammaproteobacteria bacterium]|nr:hypothetical protein [Gammaproteobacteria bacterium]